MEPQLWGLLQTTYGSECVGYLLDLDLDQLEQLEVGALTLDGTRANITEALIWIANSALASGRDSFSRRSALEGWLSARAEGDSRYLIRALHEGSGATAAIWDTEDAIAHILQRELEDVYGFMLLPPEDPVLGVGLPLSNHPLQTEFQDLVMNDEAFKLIFTTKTDSIGWRGSYLGMSQGGGLQLWGLDERLLCSALYLARLETASPTIEQVGAKVETVLSMCRKSLKGGTVMVPVRFGLTGVILPTDFTPAQSGNCTIRAADDRDWHIHSRTGISGQLGNDAVNVNYVGDIVVETEASYRIKITSGQDFLETVPKWPDALMRPLEEVGDLINAIRLGLVLASDSNQPCNLASTWISTFDPLSRTPALSWTDPTQAINLQPRQLTDEEVSNWLQWSGRISTNVTKSTAISIRRALKAVGERQSVEDLLVDSVIVWENLFGAASETTHRVSASLAWLLADTFEGRAQLQKELKSLYNFRSQIVHGSKVARAEDYKKAQRALTVALDTLRAILRDRPDLLQLRNGEERSIKILLGG